MVVHPVNGIVPSTPLRPAPSTFSLAARMKRGGGARRALSNLGNNDTQANLRLAESLLTVSQEKFAKKWNFDPVEVVPLAPGRYLWAPVTSNQAQSPAESKGMDTVVKGSDILTCFTLPKSGFSHSAEEPRVPELHPTAEVDTVNSQEDATTVLLASPNTSSVLSVEDNNDSGIVTDESLSESPLPARSSTNTTQTTITDYLRCSKKRVLVLEDEEVLLPSPKRQQHHTTTSTPATSSAASATQLHK